MKERIAASVYSAFERIKYLFQICFVMKPKPMYCQVLSWEGLVEQTFWVAYHNHSNVESMEAGGV